VVARRKSLLPAYAVHGDPDHPVVVRTLLDHILIRRDAKQLSDQVSPALLHELGARLADHVKHEEHELFPLVERTLPGSALAELGERLLDPEPGERLLDHGQW
jgi:hypothetical protein